MLENVCTIFMKGEPSWIGNNTEPCLHVRAMWLKKQGGQVVTIKFVLVRTSQRNHILEQEF